MRFTKIKTLTIILCLLVISNVSATHIMGGELTYTADTRNSGSTTYIVNLNFYRYCIFNNDTTAPLPYSMMLHVYAINPSNPDTFALVDNIILEQYYNDSVTPPFNGPSCTFTPDVCVQYGNYGASVTLNDNAGGYRLVVSARARNGIILNIQNPLDAGIVFYALVPPNSRNNSSAYFTELPLPYLCIQDTLTLVNNAYDDDGDVLRYRFVQPIESINIDSIAGHGYPMINPLNLVISSAGYSVTKPFGPGSYATIDSTNGLTRFYIPNQGFYVVAVEVSEYRLGVLISRVRRDYQIIAIACPPNKAPVLVSPAGQNATSLTMTEGDTLCFNVSFNDPNMDSIVLTSSGEIFTIADINPKATFNGVNGTGVAGGNFCWITQCGYARITPYQFTLSAADNGCPSKRKDVTFSVKVNPRSNLLPSPTVSFSFYPPEPFCPGTLVRFSSVATNTGAFPVYSWTINGFEVSNDTFYSTDQLNDNDIINLTLTSSSTCALTPYAVAGSDTVSLFEKPIAAFSYLPIKIDELQPDVQFFNECTGGTLFQWNFYQSIIDSTFNTRHIFPDTGSYKVILTAANNSGCVDSSEKTIYVEAIPTVYVPTAFTPNDDGLNDIFKPAYNSYSTAELSVFNRWGKQVFYSDHVQQGWNGKTDSGINCPQGTYIYHLTLKNPKESKTINGTLHIIR